MQSGLKIAKLLQAKGFKAFYVGGFARDMLLKRESDNIDIATDATPEQVEKILSKNKFNHKPVGKKFGSILAIIDGFKIEITTFRAEGYYSDNRHPDQVQFIKDYLADAKRRDFTVNALYYDPITKQTFDPTNGVKDLRLKLLRFVGDPKKRIDEDALRMLRGVRLVTQLGFKLEKNSFAAIKTRAKYIQGVSGERIKAELDKILLSKNRVAGMRLLDEIGLLRFIIPETVAIKTFSHKSKMYHLEGTIFDHTVLALSKVREPDLDLLYAILFHDMGKPNKAKWVLKTEGWVFSTKGHADVGAEIFLKFADRLKFSRSDIKNIEWIIRNHMLMFDFWNMKAAKQIAIAENPNFSKLMSHWGYDEEGTVRAKQVDDHHKKYLKSLSIGKKLLSALKLKKDLLARLANGNTIMRHSKLKPGRELGFKIQDVKVQIVLGKIKKELDLKKFLDKQE